MTFENHEIFEPFGINDITFVTTPFDPTSFSSGAPLSTVLTRGKRLYGYKYTTQDASIEKQRRTESKTVLIDVNGNLIDYKYSYLFPGEFFASDNDLFDAHSVPRQFANVSTDVIFKHLSEITLDANARYLIIVEEPDVTFTVRELQWCGDRTVQKNLGEQCDQGSDNGIVCTPVSDSTCTYCDTECHTTVVCGDGTTESCAATRAASELAEFYQYQNQVKLSNFTLTPFVSTPNEPAISGMNGFYVATVDGTDWTAWGIVDDGGGIIYAGIGKTTDPPDALPIFTRQIALFVRGQQPKDNPFYPLNNYLAVHSSADDVSSETRFFMAKAILDVFHQHRNLPLSNFGQPIRSVIESISVPAEQVAYLVGIIRADWDLNYLPDPAGMADNFCEIIEGLRTRVSRLFVLSPEYRYGNQNRPFPLEGDFITSKGLYTTLIGDLISQDRSEHPRFQAFLENIAELHLNRNLSKMRSVYFESVNPSALLQFVDPWYAMGKQKTATTQEATEVALFVLQAHYFFPKGSSQSQSSLTIYRSIMDTIIERAEAENTLDAFQNMVSRVFLVYSPDDRLIALKMLTPEQQHRIITILIDRFSAAGSLEFANQMSVIRFSALLLMQGFPDTNQRVSLSLLLLANLQENISSALAQQPPGPEATLLVNIALSAKALDRRADVLPLLDRFIVPFSGDKTFGPDDFQQRKDSIHGFWMNHGVFVADRAEVLSRNHGIIDALNVLFDTYDFSPVWDVLDFYREYPANTGAANRTIYYPISDYQLSFQSALDEFQSSLIDSVIIHEAGHLIFDYGGSVLDHQWGDLYDRSSRDHLTDDFVIFPQVSTDYSYSRYAEDAANTNVGWYVNNKEFLRLAINSASRGRYQLLGKYVFWANLITGIRQGDSYPMLRQVVEHLPVSQGGARHRFETDGNVTILSRNAKGDITSLTDGTAVYTFTYEDSELMGVSIN
ncbi:MAG: hypothetical protein PHZ00_04890 [Candidatus Peribacteraceae bacterium]|nr:hypothetical protein [Candidatus Peribacteraceae bacterium]